MKKLVLSCNLSRIQAFSKAAPTIYTVQHYATTTTKRRIPPKSLLEKQRRRLERQKQSLRVSQSQVKVDQQPFSSFDDIAKLFKTNTISEEEDEDSWQRKYEETIRHRYESGGLTDLLGEKFQLASPNARLSTSVLLREFPRLSQEDVDLIKYSLGKLEGGIKWDRLPIYQQQLLYYLAYGPIGPRAGFHFDKLKQDEVKKSALLWVNGIDPLTKGVLVLFVIICAIGVTSEMRSNSRERGQKGYRCR